jgi:hypothetical protein
VEQAAEFVARRGVRIVEVESEAGTRYIPAETGGYEAVPHPTPGKRDTGDLMLAAFSFGIPLLGLLVAAIRFGTRTRGAASPLLMSILGMLFWGVAIAAAYSS